MSRKVVLFEMNPATKRKRTALSAYIQRAIVPEPSVQGLVVIGSVARGIARDDSDIDAVVFLNPFDVYAVPAESKWQSEDGTYHGVFSHVENIIQLDFERLDLAHWSEPTFVWPESICAELSEGWIAFDRKGDIRELIVGRTTFSDQLRQERLDDAIARLDWLLSAPDRAWTDLGPGIAHYRLHAAFDTLLQALFAYNRRWRTWRSRELSDVLNLPWLPQRFDEQLLLASNALSDTRAGYQQRVRLLRDSFDALVAQCQQEGLYGAHAVSEAFIRQHDEPGRDWNMDAWNQAHQDRNRSA